MGWLHFLATPAFALPWFAAALLSSAWVLYDTLTANIALNDPLKACWPILLLFFGVIGLALYLIASRPPGISQLHGEAKKDAFDAYVAPKWRKTIGSAAHCVGGDGLGIMTAMALARIWHLSFWAEFWFEYAVGYAFGWFIFQLWAFRGMGNGWGASLWKGGRAEFFSMITVMVGMGLVMRFVTPAVVGHRPLPDEWAFWSFGALGLMVGFAATYPMNRWLVGIGWKHGQGHMDAQPA